MYRQTASVGGSLTLLGLGILSLAVQGKADDDLTSLQEQAMKTAVLKVAPCIVQIETSGGTDRIGSGPKGPQIRKGTGPTTGLVASADGYIISSAFNFANKPTAIFVTVPGHKDHLAAKVIATDQTRMLTLLKVEANGLAVPTAAPKKDFRIGQTAIALGRTWASVDQAPSVSVGIISALGRIWGKAIQTDAKVSPVNYGGPLVDIQGRVLGVLVPASPFGQDETAGVEWYDSGIGFAIPLEDINAMLPRLKDGKDLKRGLLGITWPPGQDPYGVPPAVGTVLPRSAADQAGIKPGDVFIEIDGVKVVRQAQVQHVLGTKYEGDVIAVKVKRGAEEKSFKTITLTGDQLAYAQPFLGILPMRDDPELGVEVRYVFPKSPADAAGIKVGDRIMSMGPGPTPKAFSGRDELMTLLNLQLPGNEVKVEVKRPEAKDLLTLTLRLDTLPDTIPDQVPPEASFHKALEVRKKVKAAGPMPPKKDDKRDEKKDEKKEAKKPPETGLIKRANGAGDHQYWIYVPDNYDPNIAHGLVVWLHAPAKGKDKEQDADNMADIWDNFCADYHLILVGPKAENDSGWLASEGDFVRETINNVLNEYTIDRQRIVAHGMDSGGQMAFRLGFSTRDLIRGVATTGAVLPVKLDGETVNQRLSFFVITGDKDPMAKLIAEGKDQLAAKKYPVVFRSIPNLGRQYPDAGTLKELARWIDALDRQ